MTFTLAAYPSKISFLITVPPMQDFRKIIQFYYNKITYIYIL